VLCAAAAQAQAHYNGFSVVLLLGDTQGAASGDGLPVVAGQRKALADVKDFLPYKSYKVLDTQWLRSGSTRIKGLDDQEYDLEVTDMDLVIPSPVRRSGVVKVAFKLQEVGLVADGREDFARLSQAATLEKMLALKEQELAAFKTGRFNGSNPQTIGATEIEIARLKKEIRLARARKLIDSTFEMSPGETVVVGTSKTGGGDKGLVVLLTAVAAGVK